MAIKVLNEEFSQDGSNLQRFVSEAKAASALNHPNILTIYEFGEAEDARFIVSELIEGKTLREIIRVRSRSDSVRATRVNLAVLYDSLGMRDEAFAVLEKAYAERYEHLGYIRGLP